MKRPWRLAWMALACMLALLGLLALWLPATWLDESLRLVSRGALGLGDTGGSFWQGEGRLQGLLPHGEVVTLATLRWSFGFADLPRGKLRFTARAIRDDRVILLATLRPGGIEVHDMELALPAAMLGHLSPTLREAGLSGQISMSARDFSIDDAGVRGQAEARWEDAASSLVAVRPLGSYQFEAHGEADALRLRLTTLQGVLGLSGDARLQGAQPPDYRLLARVDAAREETLAPLLRLFGRRRDDGVYELNFTEGVLLSGNP